LATDKLKQYAVDIGLDAETFNTCLDSGTFRGDVQRDYQQGEQVGVTGTPAFFINGRFLSGAQPFEAFRAIIEDELRQ
jgi:protein-disulfide isomerase